ncbi:NADPH:quinone reductase [Streptomyces sp. IMTB 2501]|uniref:NADPH:quinone reductase n=1 Tax=Streptomyces sp. IMTB 2501 TaxID=1776340 RepID=UPI00096FB178|nr:NADPH:quinone reductase [Streptomyces sp. IMTB 2501]OLZ60612.1 NADPH:quinone reductase [Streptomyces sp. IMTB 2501]
MKAIAYARRGGPEVLELLDRPLPEPGPGQVRVRIRVSGVNPTDWKARGGGPTDWKGAAPDQVLPVPQVPHQDGAGLVDAVGEGVDQGLLGRRVWVWEAAWMRPDGTAQEYVVLPERQAVPLPDNAAFDLGACLGIPGFTAHRALTLPGDGPERLGPGTLTGRTVLVAGGAGAVGNAAIQLARWSGATVVTTVSSAEKAALARAAGAEHVVDYRTADAAGAIRAAVPRGVDLVVEVAPAVNAELDQQVLSYGGTVVFYANDGDNTLTLPVFDQFIAGTRWQGLLVYAVPPQAKAQAVADLTAAVEAGALRVGEESGLPLHRFALEKTAEAQQAVQDGTIGRVLVDVAHF